MSVSIRLQRHGRRNRPYYHIVAADSRKKRDGRFIEKLGIYDPIENPSVMRVNEDRVRYWFGVGAEVSTTASNIFKKLGLSLERTKTVQPKKG